MSLTGSSSSGPLLFQLLQERKRFAELIRQGKDMPLVSAENLQECERGLRARLAAGEPAIPLGVALMNRGLINSRQLEDLLRSVREGTRELLGREDKERLRKAQAESNRSLESLMISLGLADEEEIAIAYAEHLRLPIARRGQAKRFGELAVMLMGVPELTMETIERCVARQRTMGAERPRLGEMLVLEGHLSQERIGIILEAQERSFEEAQRLVTSPAVAKLLPERFCHEHLLAPLDNADGVLRVAMVNPTNALVLEEVQYLARMPVEALVGPYSAVIASLHHAFGARDMVREIVGDQYDTNTAPQEDTAVLDLEELVPPGKDGQIIRLANSILAEAIRNGVSDIHLEPFEKDVKVRYRLDGVLSDITPPPKPMFIPLISRFKILAKMDIAEKRIPQDGAIAVKLGEARVDLRVNTVPTVYGEKMVMRLLSRGGVPLEFAKMGFGTDQIAHFRKAIHSPHGLVFVTGPTGSGKSTTLYAALQELNKPGVNICTVEDPVEYKMHGLNQIHVKSQVGLTFASALRAFLRQDPDIIMVGEVRDRETAEICLRAALTGHLVLSTLHTNSALAAIPRLIDMGVEPFLLAATLRLVQAQRLVRRLCQVCREQYVLDAATAQRVGLRPGEMLYKAVGCKQCRGIGYKGRVGIYEVVPVAGEIAAQIQERASTARIEEISRANGIRFMADAGLAKVREGLTSLEEVLSITFEGD